MIRQQCLHYFVQTFLREGLYDEFGTAGVQCVDCLASCVFPGHGYYGHLRVVGPYPTQDVESVAVVLQAESLVVATVPLTE